MSIERTIKNESNTIAGKFFSDLVITTGLERVDKKHCVKGEVLLNEEPYELYSYDIINGLGIFDYLLIPKNIDFSKGICGDVYRLSTYINGYHFEKISFKNDTLCQTIYNLLNDRKVDGQGLTLSKHVKKYTYDKSVYDKLYKYLESKEAFYHGYLRVPDNKYTSNTMYNLITITKSNNIIRGKIVDMNDSVNSLKRLIDEDDYEIIDGGHSTLLDIIDSFDSRKEKINQ